MLRMAGVLVLLGAVVAIALTPGAALLFFLVVLAIALLLSVAWAFLSPARRERIKLASWWKFLADVFWGIG